MRNSHSRKPFILNYALPILLFILISYILYPFSRFGIVSDEISYLTIAQRYLDGDYAKAINGYWSPLSIWALVLSHKLTSLPLIPLAYIINSMCFIGFISLSIFLFNKFIETRFERVVFGISIATFFALNVPVNLFADAMSCFFMMFALVVLIKDNFSKSPILWIILGFIITLAYLSKSYAFYILPFLTGIALLWQLKNEGNLSIKKWLLPMGTVVLTLLIFSSPWLILLHQKYGIWTISNAGQVNTNWALKAFPYFNEEKGLLVPPSYSDGLSGWEDPWINHGDILSPFDSPYLFIKQLLRIGINLLKWIISVNSFSAFYFPLWIGSFIYMLKNRKETKNGKFSIIIICFLLFPIGYFLIAIADRYFWLTIPLAMLIGVVIFQHYIYKHLSRILQKLLILLFFASWLPFLILERKGSWNEGKGDYEIAMQIKEMGIQGSFVSNIFSNYQEQFRISYFSNNPYYMYFGERFSTHELLIEANNQKINYYFYFYENSGEDYQLKGLNGESLTDLTEGKIHGLKVFELQKNTLPLKKHSLLAF